MHGTCRNRPNECVCNDGYFGPTCTEHALLHTVGEWVVKRATHLFIIVSSVCTMLVVLPSLHNNHWKRRRHAVLRARARSTGRRVRFDTPSN